MLNILPFTRKQEGFILPYILFILAFVLLFVTSSVHIYQNNIQLTHHHIQQLTFETLFQMGLKRFEEDLENDEVPASKSHSDKQKMNYSFPDGDVSIEYRKIKRKEEKDIGAPAYYLIFEMKKDELQYSFSHYVPLPDENE